jgi:flagellar biosynthetic protein FliQ
MTPESAVDLARQALMVALAVGLPVLIACLLAGLVTGLLGALTSVQDPTLSLLPKVLAVAMTLLAAGGWMLGKLVEYSRHMFGSLP